MNQFRDLTEVFDPSLYLPIAGKTYRIPPPDGETGLRLILLMKVGINAATGTPMSATNAAQLKLDGSDEEAFLRDNLGTAYQDMKTDGVAWEFIQHAAQTAFLRWTVGADQAMNYWNGAGVDVGKAAPGLHPTVTPTGAAAGSTTRSQASPTGTKTAPKRKGKRKGKGRR